MAEATENYWPGNGTPIGLGEELEQFRLELIGLVDAECRSCDLALGGINSALWQLWAIKDASARQAGKDNLRESVKNTYADGECPGIGSAGDCRLFLPTNRLRAPGLTDVTISAILEHSNQRNLVNRSTRPPVLKASHVKSQNKKNSQD